MNSDLTIEISDLGEETIFNKVISSPKNKLLLANHSVSPAKIPANISPVLESTENLAPINSDAKPESDIIETNITATVDISRNSKVSSLIAVPFYSHAIESVFRSFPFAELNSLEQNTAPINIIRGTEEINADIVPAIVTQIVSTIEISTELPTQDFQNEDSCLLKQKYLNELQLALDWNTQGHLLRVQGDLNGAVNMYQNSIQQLERLIDHLPLHSSTPAGQSGSPMYPKLTTEATAIILHESHSNALTNVYYECLNNLAEALLEQLLIGRRNVNYHLDINFAEETDRDLLSFKRSAALQEQYDVIIELYRRILKGKKRIFGSHHVQTLRIQYFIAVVLTEKGMLKESEQILRSILARFEHDNTCSLDELAVASKLGQVLLWKSEIDEASNLFQRCSKAYESLEGYSVSIATWENMHRYANLLTLKMDKNSHSEAEIIYRKIISGREKIYGRRDVRTLVSVLCLAKLLSVNGEGQVREAVDLFKRVVTDSEISMGEEHPFTLTCIHDMANCLTSSLKDFVSAEVMYRRALVGRRNAMGSDHPDTLLSGLHLVLLILLIQKSKSPNENGNDDTHAGGEGDRLQEAEELIRAVVAGRARCFGDRHVLTLEATSQWAAVLCSQGRYLEAENRLLRAYEGLKATAATTTSTSSASNNSSASSSNGVTGGGSSGGRDKQLCDTARALGSLYSHQLLSYSKAAEYLQVCYFGYNRIFGIDHTLTLTVRQELDYALKMIHGNALLRDEDAVSGRASSPSSSLSPPTSQASSPVPPSGPKSSRTLLTVHRNWRLL